MSGAGLSAEAPAVCIFCRIAVGETATELIASNDLAVAFVDLVPQAPTHVLVVPRGHYRDVCALANDPAALGAVVGLAEQVAAAVPGGAFRLVFNTGAAAGQSVFHAHGHVLAGRPLSWPPG